MTVRISGVLKDGSFLTQRVQLPPFTSDPPTLPRSNERLGKVSVFWENGNKFLTHLMSPD